MGKKLNINLSLENVTFKDVTEPVKPQQVFYNFLSDCIALYGMQTNRLSEADREAVYGIRAKFNEVLKTDATEIELDDAWLGFIRKVFREGKFDPTILNERIERLVKEVKDR